MKRKMNPISYLWKKCLRNYRDYGISVFFKKAFLYLLYPLYRNQTYLIYSIDLSKHSITQTVPPPPEYTYRFIGTHEVELIDKIEKMEEWIGVRSKLVNGYKCLACLKEDVVAGFNIVAFDDIDIPLIKFKKKLRDGQCFSVQISVHPDYRSCGIGTTLRKEIFTNLRNMGYTRLYGGTQQQNNSNRRLSQKVGLRVFASINYRYILGLERHKVKRVKDVQKTA